MDTIKANELRLKNLINYVSSEGHVVEHEVNWQHFKWLSEDAGGFNLANKPIPLSEDWMKRCGFERKEGRITWILKISDEEQGCTLQRWADNDHVSVCRSGIAAIHCECKYVHQLQNLYFALTGEELTMEGGSDGSI